MAAIDPRYPGKMLTPAHAIERIRKLAKGEYAWGFVEAVEALAAIRDVVLRVRAPKPDHRSRSRKSPGGAR